MAKRSASYDKLPLWSVALLSRVAVCTLMYASDLLVPDWDDGDPTVVRFSAPKGLSAFARWDAARFLVLARDGYTTEQWHAFFPALPLLIRFLAPSWAGNAGLVVAGLAITNASFVISALVLKRLCLQLGLDPKLAERAALLYCIGPGSIFHSSVYTESPFALCTFGGVSLLLRGQRALAAGVFCLGTMFRANGIVNVGFFAYDGLLWCTRRQPRPLIADLFAAMLVVSPYFIWEAYGYAKFCTPAGTAGTAPSWCASSLPSLYGHVQRAYWGNGFLLYWQLKQLPNFLLAGPALAVAFCASMAYALNIYRVGFCVFSRSSGLYGPALVPHVVQMTVLASIAFFGMNVQVTTRFLSAAAPSFHIWLAHASLQPRSYVLVRGYLILFGLLGILMHPNCLPWT